MTPYTPTATLHDTISTIDGSDLFAPAGFDAPLIELADNIEYLRQATRVGSASITLPIEDATPEDFGGTEWQYFPYAWIENGVGTRKLVIPVDVPVGTVISALSINCFAGYSGNTHASLPATKPRIKLVEVDQLGGFTDIQTQIDASANVAAYDAAHSIDLVLSSPYTTIGNRRYVLSVQGESGANSVATSFAVTSASCAKTGP